MEASSEPPNLEERLYAMVIRNMNNVPTNEPAQNISLPPHAQDMPLPPYPQGMPVSPHPQDMPLPPHPQDMPLPPHPQDMPLPPHLQSMPLPPHMRGMPLPPHMQGASAGEQAAFIQERMMQHVPVVPVITQQPLQHQRRQQQQQQPSPGLLPRVPHASRTHHTPPQANSARGRSYASRGLGSLRPVGDGSAGAASTGSWRQPSQPMLQGTSYCPPDAQPVTRGSFAQPASILPPAKDMNATSATKARQKGGTSFSQAPGRTGPPITPQPPGPPTAQSHSPGPPQETRQAGQTAYQRIVEQQSRLLHNMALTVIAEAAISEQELQEKEAFRAAVESICRDTIAGIEQPAANGGHVERDTVRLVSFGSLSTGFALKASDMDLMLLSPHSQPPVTSADSPIPRILEKAFLEKNWGARLLTRTRVPIIQLCEQPTKKLLDGLKEHRVRWEKGEEPDAYEPQEEDVDTTAEAPPAVDQPAPEATLESKTLESKTLESKALESKAAQERLLADGPKLQPQRSDEDIWAYHYRARRILRRFEQDNVQPPENGTPSNQRDAPVAFVEAFISGLADETLRERVWQHVALKDKVQLPSFSDAWLHVEGECFVIAWEWREIREAVHGREQEGERIVKAWRELHTSEIRNKAKFGTSLHRSWNRLRSLSSIRLQLLSQWQREFLESYHGRCKNILLDLGGRDWTDRCLKPLTNRERKVLAAVIDRLVNGIRNLSIKQELQTYLSTRSDLSLAQVIQQHVAEQRIHTFMKGLEKGLYSAVDGEAVTEYAKLVRQDGAEATKASEKVMKLICGSPGSTQKAEVSTTIEFPTKGVGIRCDVNFTNHLALHNSCMLRCYSHCDPRVRQMVLAVKTWAKYRDINSPYHGTLSSYGYVLMVLHFLINIATPPVVPNLQLAWKPPKPGADATAAAEEEPAVDGYDVRFWRNEQEIEQLAQSGKLTTNQQPLGALLRQFFEYFTVCGRHVIGQGFSWSTNVISVRSKGGLLSKYSKGWTEAKTTFAGAAQPGQGRKEVRHRYLFAIEDPFETEHNIARTVTHNGIVAIRDEFRRAWRIISTCGHGPNTQSIKEVFQQRTMPVPPPSASGKAA